MMKLGDTVRIEVPHRIDTSEWSARLAYLFEHRRPEPFPCEVVTLTLQSDVDQINSVGLDAWASQRKGMSRADSRRAFKDAIKGETSV